MSASPEHTEPFAARLHVLVRLIRPLHAAIVHALRGYFARAPGWVLLTTRGRRTGLPREVLLPCARGHDCIIVISTYGWRSDWIRNIRTHPTVQVTSAGQIVPARGEIVEDIVRKQDLVTSYPFVPAAPLAVVHAVALTIFRPLVVRGLRHWVMPRPVVVIHLAPAAPGAGAEPLGHKSVERRRVDVRGEALGLREPNVVEDDEENTRRAGR